MKTFILTCFVFFSFLGQGVRAQSVAAEQSDYLVVIGAFAVKENATRVTEKARKLKLQPKVELNTVKNVYYVYVLRTPDREAAIAEATKIRETGRYNDTWVFTKAEASKPVVEEKIKEEVVVIAPPLVTPEPVLVLPVVVIDPEKERHDKIKSEVDKKSMTLKKGETETLDYIFFYKDASVLRPESRYAVDKLVRILKQNPNEKIRIHGHTNGNEPGIIIRRNEKSVDFFSLDNTVEDSGSAKKLSELRATAILDYLVSNGINKNRMSIKAWGGKKPLFKVDEEKAEANVRVEIEVLEK